MKKKKRGKDRKQKLSEEPMTLRPIVSRRPCWGGIETVDYNYDPPQVTRHKGERR